MDTAIWSRAPAWTRPLIAVARRFAFISAEEGAWCIVHLVAGPELSGITGQYFEDNTVVDPAPLARDDGLARRLWQESERLTGLIQGASKPVVPQPVPATGAHL